MSPVPGDPAAVRLKADVAAAAHRKIAEGVGAAVDARPRIVWVGDVGDVCRSRLDLGLNAGDALAASLAAIGPVLRTYADKLARQQSAVAQADAAVRDASRRTDANPFDLVAWGDYVAARTARLRAAVVAESAAGAAAAEIRRIVAGGEPADDALAEHRLRSEPLGPGAVDASWDQADVRQGQIGDCYLLSSLMGLMRTDAGDALLRRNVRYDGYAKQYVVTLYEDGKPVEVRVDAGYNDGVTTPDHRRSIASIYEAALGTYLGRPDLDDGGWPKDAMELVTGQSASTYDAGSHVDDIRRRLEDGAAVTADTAGRPVVEDVTVEIEQGGRLVQKHCSIAGGHAYMVERIDADGSVWLRNPWGAGNSFDGGDAFRMSAQDFERVFRQVAVSGTPS